MSTTIIDFWRSHPSYWIAQHNQAKADLHITRQFFDVEYRTNSLIGQVVFLDQFSRHFQRVRSDFGEEQVTQRRREACRLVIAHLPEIRSSSRPDFLFFLMPIKHLALKKDEVVFQLLRDPFRFLFDELQQRDLRVSDRLTDFFEDTYRKYYSLETVQRQMTIASPLSGVYDPGHICEYYPEKYTMPHYLQRLQDVHLQNPRLHPLEQTLPKDPRPLVVSLSGGVDSMVLLSLLVRKKVPVVAVHLVYGNRKESEEELAFVSNFCQKVSVSLYLYRIQHLKRDRVRRAFYEDMTRKIRFDLYRSLPVTTPPHVLLGHIREDVIENIWNNFAKNQHGNDLIQMKTKDVVEGNVVLLRPFLHVPKSDVIHCSQLLGIPFLKNTTPLWSERGRFRKDFYPAYQRQFGEGADTRMLEMAQHLQNQSDMLSRLLFQPIFSTFDPETRSVSIQRAVEAGLDKHGWSFLFEILCHKYLSVPKPSIHAVRQFIQRLHQCRHRPFTMPLKKQLTVRRTGYILTFDTGEEEFCKN